MTLIKKNCLFMAQVLICDKAKVYTVTVVFITLQQTYRICLNLEKCVKYETSMNF